MPTEYVAIRDGIARLDPTNGVNDFHFPFQVSPPVNAATVLAFRADPNGEITLQVRLNTTIVLTQTFNTAPQRSWHEIVAAGALHATGNELTISTPSGGSGTIDVSDIVLFYKTA